MTDKVAGVEYAGLENDRLENDGLENDGRLHAFVAVVRRRLKCPNSVLYFPGLAFSSPSNSSPHRSAIFQVRHFPPPATWSVIFQVRHFHPLLWSVIFHTACSDPAFSAPPMCFSSSSSQMVCRAAFNSFVVFALDGVSGAFPA